MEIFARQQFTVSGTPTQSAVFDLADRVDIFKLRIDLPKSDRTVSWSKDQHIAVLVMLSLDAGATWESLTAYTTHGGIHVERGEEAEQNVHVCQIDPRSPWHGAKGRKVKVSFAVLHGEAPELTVDFEAI